MGTARLDAEVRARVRARVLRGSFVHRHFAGPPAPLVVGRGYGRGGPVVA